MKECLVYAILVACCAAELRRPWQQQQQQVQAHSGLTVVNPPQLSPQSRISRRGPMPGYLPLRPVSAPRHPRWFGAETAPKATYLRPPSNYERFPPFWNDEGSKHARNRRPQSHRHAKKDCNPCNSVPWTPIFKSPAGLSSDHKPRELVPHIDVYPEPSIIQDSVVIPHSLNVDLAPPALFGHSNQLVSLPVGNLPVSPDILLPPQQTVPFPELSPHPVAPVHNSFPFHREQETLLPPKTSSNVVVTISEPDPPQDIHLVPHDQHSEPSTLTHSSNPYNAQRPKQGLDIVKSVSVAEYTSSIEHPIKIIQSRPYIDINPQHGNQNYRPNTKPVNTNTPLQPPPQKPAPAYNAPSPPNNAEHTYEKTPQTGSQKVSDFILGVNKINDPKATGFYDSSPAGSSKITEQTSQQESTDYTNTKEKATRYEDSTSDVLDPNILIPPPLPPHLTQLLPTYETAFLHPMFPIEHQGVAGVVNGALLPPPAPQPLNPTTLQPSDPSIPPKKIQIIIPYTTVNNQELDQNALGSRLQPVQSDGDSGENSPTWPPIVVPNNQPRKIPKNQNFNNFKNENWGEGQPSESNQVKHILASNIRDLLKKEMEPKQNIRLQKNIDNWTALEYSNHKIVGKKHPGDVISHAQAVTSIPGTSISHLLLPSKKIPDGYFTTTAAPDFDDPVTTNFPASSVSVNSKPFTTVSMYSSVAWNGPSARSSTISGSRRQQLQTTTPLTDSDNDIVPRWSNLKVSIAPGTNEKVYVVTPESVWGSSRRSTRHIETTEKYTPQESRNLMASKVETKNNETEVITEKSKLKQKPLYPKSTPLFRVKNNGSRYEKITKFTKPKLIDKFFATTTKPLVPFTTTTTLKTPKLVEETTESLSTASTSAAAFPFRNGGELPLEMAQVNFSSSQLVFKNAGSRKTLIKQVKTNNRRGKEGKPSATTQKTAIVKDGAHKSPEVMEVDVVLPFRESIKVQKKPTNFDKKKQPEKTGEKTDEAANINPEEPNITEDEREEINSLMKAQAKANRTLFAVETDLKPDEPNISEDDRENINNLMKDQAAKENETLLAVETKVPPSMPGGVFGETRPENSSRSLLDTIKLLRDFLADTTSEETSSERTEQIDRVIKKIDSKDGAKKLSKEPYKYNFPEYLVGELNLTKDEMGLVEGAMVELRKKRVKKN